MPAAKGPGVLVSADPGGWGLMLVISSNHCTTDKHQNSPPSPFYWRTFLRVLKNTHLWRHCCRHYTEYFHDTRKFSSFNVGLIYTTGHTKLASTPYALLLPLDTIPTKRGSCVVMFESKDKIFQGLTRVTSSLPFHQQVLTKPSSRVFTDPAQSPHAWVRTLAAHWRV